MVVDEFMAASKRPIPIKLILPRSGVSFLLFSSSRGSSISARVLSVKIRISKISLKSAVSICQFYKLISIDSSWINFLKRNNETEGGNWNFFPIGLGLFSVNNCFLPRDKKRFSFVLESSTITGRTSEIPDPDSAWSILGAKSIGEGRFSFLNFRLSETRTNSSGLTSLCSLPAGTSSWERSKRPDIHAGETISPALCSASCSFLPRERIFEKSRFLSVIGLLFEKSSSSQVTL